MIQKRFYRRLITCLIRSSFLALTGSLAASCSNANTNIEPSLEPDASTLEKEDSSFFVNTNSDGFSIGNSDVIFNDDALIPTGDGSVCAAQSAPAELLPLDMFVMLDQSGSMANCVTSGDQGKCPIGGTKWTVQIGALDTTFKSPNMNGVNTAFQLFPHPLDLSRLTTTPLFCGYYNPNAGEQPKTPTCSTACTARYKPGRCFNSTKNELTYKSCLSNADCNASANEQCQEYGVCSNGDGNTLCSPLNSACPNGGTCIPSGACYVPNQIASTSFDCNASHYSTPYIDMGLYNDARSLRLSQLTMIPAAGSTPTGRALKGAIDYMSQRKLQFPDRQAVVILATDGVPSINSSCNDTIKDTDANYIVDLATQGFSKGVRTFAIGTFSASEANNPTFQGRQLLERIAPAGMGDPNQKPFIVVANEELGQKFSEALIAIRRASAPVCEFRVSNEARADYSKVNVQLTNQNQSPVTIPYVGSAAQCPGANSTDAGRDADAGVAGDGWYYDVDPAVGTPNKITLCPGSCDNVKRNPVSVSIVYGCKTVIIRVN